MSSPPQVLLCELSKLGERGKRGLTNHMISSFPTVTIATTLPVLERQANSQQFAAEPWGSAPQCEKIKVRRGRGDPPGEKSEENNRKGP